MKSIGIGIIVLLTIFGLAFLCYRGDFDCKKTDNKHNIIIKFDGRDSEIPKDGTLLRIKNTVEDTIIVSPASDDDCRAQLEEHGQG